MDEIESFRQFLKEQGLKLTSQRETILQRVRRIRKHFSAEELFETLRDEGQNISKATVYRTLALLVEAEMVDEHDFEQGHKTYEWAAHDTHHDHLICVSCSRIVEFHNERIEQLQDDVAAAHGFEIVSHTHQIFGRCRRCRREGRRERHVPASRPKTRSPRLA